MRSRRTKNTMGPEYKICGHFVYAAKGRQSLAALQQKNYSVKQKVPSQ